MNQYSNCLIDQIALGTGFSIHSSQLWRQQSTRYGIAVVEACADVARNCADLSDEQGIAVMNCIIKHFEDHEYERTD
jgi:hypothetical protein